MTICKDAPCYLQLNCKKVAKPNAGTKWFTDAPYMEVMQDVWFSLGRGYAVVGDPGFPSSSGAVIRKVRHSNFD